MRRNIFLDLDGTLSDPRKRLYELFKELISEAKFTFEEYWDIKRKRMNQDTLLRTYFNFNDERIKDFKKNWLLKVEEELRVDLDEPFENVSTLLASLSATNDLYIVTARQKAELALKQVRKFGWEPFFKAVLVTEQSKTKAELIRSRCKTSPKDILIGDTGEDIETAKELGLISVAVSSGFLSGEVLATYKPDYLLTSILELNETHLL